MNLEVKNVRSFRGMEGHGFNATLYIDGRKSGLVIDDGNGGCFTFEIPNEDYQKLAAYAKALPRVPFGPKFGGGDFQPNADYVVNGLVTKFESEKRIKKLVKTHIVYTSTDGELYSIKLRAPYCKEMGLKLREKYKDVAVIHNEQMTDN